LQRPAAYLLTLLGPGKGTTPFGDETTGRAAWLAAVKSGRCSIARLVRGHGPAEDCIRCEWTAEGAFLDRTEAHGAEIAALCEVLTAEAPEGYRATTDRDTFGRFVAFLRRTGDVGAKNCSGVDRFTRERVISAWQTFAPIRTYSVRRDLEDGPALAERLPLGAALKIHDEQRGNAIVIDDWTGLPACVAGIEHGCGCPLCEPWGGLSEAQGARVVRIRAARAKLAGLIEKHSALPEQDKEAA